MIIAIDGPAGSGKSTLGKALAGKLGFLFFDTGVMYRAVACTAITRGLDVHDEEGMTRLANALQIDVRPPSVDDGRDNDLIVDGDDITWAIRAPEVEGCVSVVSAYPGVRLALTTVQRRIGSRGSVVMAGRDIGTVVLPEADLKIYLDASPDVRAMRRHAERLARGETSDVVEIRASIRERDRIDSSREVAPLRPADDAHWIDSDHMSIDEVVDAVMKLVETGVSGSSQASPEGE